MDTSALGPKGAHRNEQGPQNNFLRTGLPPPPPPPHDYTIRSLGMGCKNAPLGCVFVPRVCQGGCPQVVPQWSAFFPSTSTNGKAGMHESKAFKGATKSVSMVFKMSAGFVKSCATFSGSVSSTRFCNKTTLEREPLKLSKANLMSLLSESLACNKWTCRKVPSLTLSTTGGLRFDRDACGVDIRERASSSWGGAPPTLPWVRNLSVVSAGQALPPALPVGE